MNRVRVRRGRPVLSDFRAAEGTPLVIDTETGRQYLLRDTNTVIDGLLLSPDGVWDDLRFPAQGINPPGPTNAPAVSSDLTAFPATLNFSGTALNLIAGVFQMPHAWMEGTDIRPHIHWMKAVAGAGAVGWQFRWRLMDMGVVAGAWSSWINGVSADINGAETAADTHFITSFGSIAMTGLRASVMVAWQLQRTGNTDAYNSIARLLEFDVHYQNGQLGSELEYPV